MLGGKEGADKRVWQLLKDFKYDKELHYVTIKRKTLICHFNQNTPVRPFANPSIHPSLLGTKWPKWVRNDQKRYEMIWVRIDYHIVISYPVDLGTKWPNWVRNDLGTKWLLLGTKWPKSRYEMTKVGTKWPGYEMTGNRYFSRFRNGKRTFRRAPYLPTRTGKRWQEPERSDKRWQEGLKCIYRYLGPNNTRTCH